MKDEIKELSGSIKVNPEVYEKVIEYCKKNGIKITFFASEALSEKLAKVEKEKK